MRGSSTVRQPQPEVRARVSAAGSGTSVDQAETQQGYLVEDIERNEWELDYGDDESEEGEIVDVRQEDACWGAPPAVDRERGEPPSRRSIGVLQSATSAELKLVVPRTTGRGPLPRQMALVRALMLGPGKRVPPGVDKGQAEIGVQVELGEA
ncbi:hypothetical protein NDU88_006046 [Pleurodeles waltl]|uniref:Uncharacterized protein n=1 Tax=Pleurodeles waltl TaxID=8319 RepID=A0AAV7TD20_PLEWA|nr:hypothetical protein NDU88_006046 [Pleurodeles waltl]